MDLELIRSMDSPAWTYLAAVVMLVATAGAMIAATNYIKSTKVAVPVVVLIAVVMLGPGLWFADHEENRVAGVKASVSDGFDQKYGLSLADKDMDRFRNVGHVDVTRNVETADGSLRQVLFRVVGDQVLPYTMDSEGTWTPVPAKGNDR